jgi:hypothetical protein
MSEIAMARINSFASVAQQYGLVQPSEESIFVLTSIQLQDIIKGAIQEATKPFVEKIETLETTVARQDEKIRALESTQDIHAENQFIQLQLINQLREATKKEPQPMQKDRSEILRALLAANNGKMLAKVARQKMHLSKQAFTNLLALTKEIETKPYRNDKRQKLLVLK